MSLLDDASLLVTPNAEKEGKLYSIIPTNGNGDFSVTRATTATRVNAAGLVELVPYNLLQYSEQFSNAVWTKTNVSISANTTTAPNGTLTADKLIENTALGQHALLISGGWSTTQQTASIYVKSAERTKLYIGNNSIGNGIFFDLTTGTIQGIVGAFTGTITSVGDGWYRVTATHTATAAQTFIIGTYITYTGVYLTTKDYTGDGTSGIYLWGAQLVEGTSALDYQATETRLNIPRLDYSLGSCPNILLEPQRTNLALRSEEFDNASWIVNATTISANSTTSPSGLNNADTLTADGTSSNHRISQNISISATTYSYSIYAKKNTNNFIQINTGNSFGGMWANFDINNGVVGTLGTTTGTTPTSSITSVGNGWYRCNITFTSTASGNSGTIVCSIVTSASAARAEANTLTTSVFIWGAQLEAGAYATSYIPTTSASVTRNADVISRGNIFTNGLITASGGTWFVDIRNNRVLTRDAGSVGLALADTNVGGTNSLSLRSYNQRINVAKYIAGAPTSLFATTTDTAKIAIKWNGTTADVFVNGVKVVSATAFTTTALEFLTNPSPVDIPKYINSMALFPTPLTDTQCIALTT
jgi:hypothetical protein